MKAKDAMTDAPLDETCEICARPIVPCEECAGRGVADGEECEVCNGARMGCPVHHDEHKKKR